MKLADWWRRRVERSGPDPALTAASGSVTFDQVGEQVARLATALVARDVQPDDRVGFLGRNKPELLVSLLATAEAGGVFTPFNTRLTNTELDFQVDDAGLRLLVVQEEFAAVAPASAVAWTVLAAAADAEAPLPEPVSRADGDDALLLYTAGSTGRPKGVRLTNGNLEANTLNALLALDLAATDRTLAWAPLFHIGGLGILTLPTLLKGGEVVLQPRFDAAEGLRLLVERQITTVLGVPTMFAALADQPGFADADLSALRLVVCGGAPLPPALARRYRARGLPLVSSYGLTECAPMVLVASGRRAAIGADQATGSPVPLTDVRVVDGELRVRGPNVMPGYWQRPAETAAAFDAEGWLRTGDLAVALPGGTYRVVGRRGDLIVSGGESIAPAEVEAVLARHPDVGQVAVLGVPDHRWGETVAAVVVLRGATGLDLEALRAFAEPHLARYKLPRRLAVLDVLPLNAAGKVAKRDLRELFGAPR